MVISTKAKFKFQKGTVKQVNLKRLSPRTADFVKHVNLALHGTSYRVASVDDYSGNPFKNKHVFGEGEVYASVSLYRVVQTPGGVRNAYDVGRILVSKSKNSFQIDVNAFSSDSHVCGDMKTVESRVSNYDF